jgi:signal transduction histidine kinase/CheY-like chemotaxis protein
MERETEFTRSFASTDGTSGLPAPRAKRSIRRVASLALRRPRVLGTTAGLLVFTFAAFGMLAVHNFASNAIESAVRRSLQGVAIAAARSVPVEAHARIHTAADEGSPAYQQALAPLEELQRTLPDIRYVYTFRQTANGIEFVVDPTTEPAPDSRPDDHTPPGTFYKPTDAAMIAAMQRKAATVSGEVYTDRWGSFVSSYAPVFAANGSVECFVGIDMDAATYQAHLRAVDAATGVGTAIAALCSTIVAYATCCWATSRRAEEVSMVKTREEAVRASQAKSDFIANVSHEIRTPMTAILGYAEILREDAARGQISDLGSSAGEVIARNGQHILGVVNDIIDAARVEAGEISIARSPIDLRAIANDAVEFLAARAAAKGIGLRFEPGISGPATTVSDPLRVRQILLNLIGNAVKFTEFGSVTVDLSVSGSRWMVSVRDTGPGMNEQELALLFRRFSQTSSADTVNGSGLGLALSQQLAHMLGGDLVVQSVPGDGTTFTLTLPRTTTPAEALMPTWTGQAEVAAADDAEPLPLAGVQVLLAEDGPDSARLCRHFLERAGASVTVASDGRQAIAFLRAADAGVFEDPFDVVLMDMEMPVMDGMQALHAIRAGGSGIPVIALTAHAGDAVRGRCIAAGFSDYLAKPADRRTLVATVAAWRPVRESTDHGTTVTSV